MVLTRLIEFLEKNATLKASLFLMMALIPMNALVFPLINDEIEKNSGFGKMDTLFSYTPTRLFSQLEAYGDTGRQIYLFSIAAVDFLYPILYTLLLSFLLTILLRNAFPPESPFVRMQLFPIGMLIFNYLSNLAWIILLMIYPHEPVSLAWFASAANTIKWCFGIFSIVALVIAVFRMLGMLTGQKPTQGDRQ